MCVRRNTYQFKPQGGKQRSFLCLQFLWRGFYCQLLVEICEAGIVLEEALALLFFFPLQSGKKGYLQDEMCYDDVICIKQINFLSSELILDFP